VARGICVETQFAPELRYELERAATAYLAELLGD